MVSHGLRPLPERMTHFFGTHVSSFLFWWQHSRWKASCIVQSFTNAGQKHLKTSKTRVAPWFTNSARCLHLSTFVRTILGIIYKLWAMCSCWKFTANCRWSWTMYRFAVYHYLLLRAGYTVHKNLESWSRIKDSCNTSYSYSFTKLPKCYLWLQNCWASRPGNPTAPFEERLEYATPRVTRVPGPASATCPVVVCLQLMHIF